MNAIELTQEQLQALRTVNGTHPRIIDPRTKEQFVLVPLAEYQRLIDEGYGDSPSLLLNLHENL